MRRERPRCPPAGAAPRSPRAPLPPLLLLPLLALALAPRPVAGDQQDCASLLRDFYEFNQKEAVPFNVDNMVYFLHVPRTAGRTFHTCLLKQGVPASKRCPKSYDHLRIDVGLPSCRLLSSHDDFSVVQQLPPGTAVVTQLRDPVDRFLSAYEFAIEVASRQVKKPPNQAKNRTATAGRTLTDEVWPWSHLVPFFVQDTRARLAAATAKADAEKAAGGPGHWLQLATEEGRTYYWNKARNTSKWQLDEADKPHLVPPLDPYNNPLTMPLAEFAAHPLAVDLVHNGEAFQVLGLTNYSHWPKADALRQCAISDQGVARELSAYAKRRLATFAHVGTTDALFESVEACAGALGMALDAPAYAQGEARRANIENPNRSLRYPEAIARGERAAAAAAAAHEKAAHDHGRGEEGPEFYDDGPPGPGGDAEGLHELAGAVRAAAARADGAAAAWNAAVRSGAPQAELRSLRLDLSRARAEVAAAQDALLAARGEEAEKRAREVANANKLIETGGGGVFWGAD
ncbi:hypothetical protein Rsub_11291 [Raphidocelis subcapitata]|uniref:WW domain-containing protein n=1 Tax=Raphidocelis subcapitata TaxID=307507 RepID=A0A2V0PI96_9CHLO|nr:hypothetical protein Rsub_11291 [Raphidocelis subcapitata]|eukprot:GBF98742.1 hypothetical protein Rsub_11291 [Raphidocelis subcapitata]